MQISIFRNSDNSPFVPSTLFLLSRVIALFIVCTSVSACGGGGGDTDSTLVSASSHTTEVRLRIVLARGPGGASTTDAAEIISHAKSTLERQLPVQIKIESYEEMPDPIPELRDPTTQELLLTAWEAWAKEVKKVARGSVIVVLVPPYERGGEYLFGGIASGRCSLSYDSSMVVAAVGPTSGGLKPESRIEKSAKGVAHEIAHILGAGHAPDESLMAPVFNFPITPKLGLNEESITEVSRCLSRGSQLSL